MKQIEEIIRNTTEEEQEKVDWTKAWSTKYPVLATYQKEVDIPKYAADPSHVHGTAGRLQLFRTGCHAGSEGYPGS